MDLKDITNAIVDFNESSAQFAGEYGLHRLEVADKVQELTDLLTKEYGGDSGAMLYLLSYLVDFIAEDNDGINKIQRRIDSAVRRLEEQEESK